MSRWIGHDHIDAVLGAAEAWRKRCFLADGSLFSDEVLWTLDNIQELKRRFLENPIEDAGRSFFDKLEEQLDNRSGRGESADGRGESAGGRGESAGGRGGLVPAPIPGLQSH